MWSALIKLSPQCWYTLQLSFTFNHEYTCSSAIIFTCYHFRGLIYWLIDCLIKWSLHLYIADWLIIIIKLLLTKWLITSRLIDWQTDWLTFWLTDSLTDKMADWLLNKWLINWLVVDWPTDLLADLLTEWLTILLPERTTCWPADRLTYWWLMD